VLALGASGKELRLARFTKDEGKLGWSAALPAAPEMAAAALGPQGKGSARHVVFASHTEQGIAVFHSRYTRDGALEPFRSVRFEPRDQEGKPLVPRLMAGTTPALYVDGKGGAWAAFLALAGEEALRLEAHFSEGMLGPHADVQATPLAPLDARPVGGALLYADDKGGSIARRELVLLLEGGKLVELKGGALQEVRVAGPVTAPILLAPGRNASYILCNSTRGLYFEPL
jgi:hypothetical protein